MLLKVYGKSHSYGLMLLCIFITDLELLYTIDAVIQIQLKKIIQGRQICS